MKEPKRNYEKDGWVVRGLAFQGKASDELSKGSGIDSKTIHNHLNFLKKNEIKVKKELWIVDESSMVDNKLLHKLMLRVEKEKGKIKVIFVGDKNQLQPIGVGNAFTQAVGHKVFSDISVVDEIVRQKNSVLKEAVYAVIKGDVKKAMDLLDKNIVELSNRDKRHEKIVSDFLKQTELGQKNSFIVSGYNSDRIDINQRIHAEKYESGTGWVFEIDDKKTIREIELNPGERMIFLQNNKNLDVKNGTLATVERVDTKEIDQGKFQNRFINEIVATTDDGRRITFDPEKYNHFDHGYALTTHKAQGSTVDRVFININTEQTNINSLNKLATPNAPSAISLV
jgi:ATP-dependent exoDNAse (exonuclease V) alpha subunit